MLTITHLQNKSYFIHPPTRAGGDFKQLDKKPMAVNFEDYSNSVLVQNEPETTDDKLNVSWCKAWEEESGQRVTGSMTCSCVECNQKLDPDHRCGAHVKVVDKKSPLFGKKFIVPICKKENHYKNTTPYRVKKDRLKEYTDIVED